MTVRELLGGAPATPQAPPCARSGELLARFMEARGRRVFEASGTLWCESRFMFESCPPVERISPDPEALDAAMRAERVMAVRFPALAGQGLASGNFVCRTRGFGIDRLSRRRRQQLRKALERVEIRALDPDELEHLGFELNLRTLARQRRFDPEYATHRGWRGFVRAVRDHQPYVFATGAFYRGRLSAYIVDCRDGAWIYGLTKMSRTEDRHLAVDGALEASQLLELSGRPDVEGVWNGFAAVTPGHDGLHAYKESMGFALEPYTMGIHLHPRYAKALTHGSAIAAAAALARLCRFDERFAMAAQVMRGARLTADRGPPETAPSSTVPVPTGDDLA